MSGNMFQFRHGLKHHALYDVWGKMKSRCYKPNDKDYSDYGGRGITVCTEWIEDFKVFYDWCMANGYEKGLEMDRRENDGNYGPDNCRFVTRSQNMRNTRRNNMVTYSGLTKSLVEWSEITGIKRYTLFNRISRLGWTIENAMETPPGTTYKGKEKLKIN